MSLPPQLTRFWSDFTTATGCPDDSRFPHAFCFGDSEALANELAALVLQGTKGATAAARWAYEAEGERLPRPGDLCILTDWGGRPRCVFEVRSVDVVPFDQVTADFAAAEGEGDGSLAWWREAHRAFFSRECAAAGRVFEESMLVVCIRFEVVHRPTAAGS